MKCNIHDFTWNCMYIVEHKCPVPALPCQPYSQVPPIVSLRSGVQAVQAWTLCCQHVQSLCRYVSCQKYLWSPFNGSKMDAFTSLRSWGLKDLQYLTKAFFWIFSIVGLIWPDFIAGGNENYIDDVWGPDFWGNCLCLAFIKDTGFQLTWAIFPTLVKTLLIHDSMN